MRLFTEKAIEAVDRMRGEGFTVKNITGEKAIMSRQGFCVYVYLDGSTCNIGAMPH